jgi:decaprenyl-phosphate phosphoribosyltransferase
MGATHHPTGAPSPSLASGLIRSLRPKQWAKNVLVFAAPVAASVIDERGALVRTLLAFACFCGAASATYLLNDARDVESDRRHPTKRNRPIAAGTVPVPVAYVLAAVLLVASVVAAFVTAGDFGWVLLAYVALTTTYSFGLKHVAIVDIVAVAAGFVLRAVGGAAAAGVPISEWFFIVTSFGALLVVTGKRHGEALELADHAAELRPTLRTYTPRFLTELRAVFLGGVLIAYCLWAFESASGDPDGAVLFQVSIVPFGVAVLRYAMLLEQGEGSEPENLLLSDRMLLGAGTVWAIIYACAVYAT